MSFEENLNNSDRSHLRGSLLFAVGRVVALCINFLMQILTVRYLSKADYGLYAFCLSISGVIAVISVFGTDKAVSRYLAVYLHRHEYEKFWSAFRVMLATICLISFFFCICFSLTWYNGFQFKQDNPSTSTLLLLASFFAFCNAADAFLLSFFAAVTKPSVVFYRRYLLTPTFKLAAASVVVLLGGGLIAFVVSQLLAVIAGVAICLGVFRRILAENQTLRVSRKSREFVPKREILGFGGTVVLGDLAFLLRSAVIPIILGLTFDEAEVASFQAVVPVARLNEFVLMAFSVLFLPRAAKLAASNQREGLDQLYSATSTWILLLTFPVFATSIIGADHLPRILFGEKYESSNVILIWLACGFFIQATFGLSTRLLRVAGGLKTLIWADLTINLLSLAVVALFTYGFGAKGGAIAVCLTFLLQAIIHQTCSIMTLRVKTLTRPMVLHFAFAVTLAFSGLVAMRYLQAGILPCLALSALVSLLMLLFFGQHLNVAETIPELQRLPFVSSFITENKTAENSTSEKEMPSEEVEDA